MKINVLQPLGIRHAVMSFILVVTCSACLFQSDAVDVPASQDQSAVVRFVKYLHQPGSTEIVGVAFSVTLYNTMSWTWADIYRTDTPAACEKDYPTPTNIVPDWVPELAKVAEYYDYGSDIAIAVNTSFYAANNSYQSATCANIMGISAVLTTQAPSSPDDCKSTQCYPMDAIFHQAESLTEQSMTLVSASDVASFYASSQENVMTAQGGIIFIRNGVYRHAPALQHHRPNMPAARVAIGLDSGRVATDQITIVYVPKGDWLNKDTGLAPGLTDADLANIMVSSLGISDAIMLDGGGSATVYLNDVAGWSGPSVLPALLNSKQHYRPVSNALGFTVTPSSQSAVTAKKAVPRSQDKAQLTGN